MRWSSEFCIVMLLIQLSSVGSVTAADSQPHAGFIEARDGLPCMRTKPRPPDCQLSTVDPFADAKEQTAQRLSRAKFYIGAGDRRHALVEAEEALKLSPQDVDIRHLVGRIAMSIGENDLAEREFRLALQQRPNDPDIEASDATRLLNLSQEGALRSFDSIVEAHPDHRYSRESRAELLMKLGQPDRAMKDLDTLLARDGHDVRLLALRANANIVSGRPQQAIADLTEALKQSTARPDLITLRAMAYEMKGDDNAALKDYEAVLGPIGALQPTYVMRGDELAKYRMQRAFVAVRLGRFADAAAEAVGALGMGGSRSILRGQVFLRQNGFPQIPLDGRESDDLRNAMQSCMALNSCFQKVSASL